MTWEPVDEEGNTVGRLPMKKSWLSRSWPYIVVAVLVAALFSMRWLL